MLPRGSRFLLAKSIRYVSSGLTTVLGIGDFLCNNLRTSVRLPAGMVSERSVESLDILTIRMDASVVLYLCDSIPSCYQRAFLQKHDVLIEVI